MKSKATLNYVQGDLFSGFGSDISVATPDEVSKEVLSMPDAKVIFYRKFFNRKESDELFRVLREEINWRQDKMNVYGKEVNLPRKTAWYGDSNKSYTFLWYSSPT